MAPLPPIRVMHPHVVLDTDGSPVVLGTRVPVRRLFSWHRQGTAVETLLKRYPQLGPARLLDALSFAYDNFELMEADLAREQAALAREQREAPPPPLSPKQRAAAARIAQQDLPFAKGKDEKGPSER